MSKARCAAAQPIQRDAALDLGREVQPCLPPDVLHHLLSRCLCRRFLQGLSGRHLRSFVTTTKPQHSLHHKLKSVPLVLTGIYPDATPAMIRQPDRSRNRPLCLHRGDLGRQQHDPPPGQLHRGRAYAGGLRVQPSKDDHTGRWPVRVIGLVAPMVPGEPIKGD